MVLTVGTDAVLAPLQFLTYSCRSLAVCTRRLADFSGTLCPRAEWSSRSESANNSERRSRFGRRWNPAQLARKIAAHVRTPGRHETAIPGLALYRLRGGLPLAVGTGTGAELRRPLGITTLGGLLLSQLLPLYTPWPC